MSSAKGLPDSGSIDLPFSAVTPVPTFTAKASPPPAPPKSKAPPEKPLPPLKVPPVTPPAFTPAAPASSAVAKPVPSKPSSPSKPLAVAKPIVTAVSTPVAAKPKPAPVQAALEEEPQEKSPFSIKDLYNDSPAWLTSLVVHMLVVIILGLIYIAPKSNDVLQLVASLANEYGNNDLRDDGLDLPVDQPDLAAPPVYIPNGDPVDDPMSAPMAAIPVTDGLTAADPSVQFSAENIGAFLSGRESGSKANLAIKFGATKGTIDSVKAALEWIVRQQNKAGHWSLDKPYSDGAIAENRNAATAMAMLALQGDGNTHLKGPYKANVAGGLKILLRSQAGNGSLHQGSPSDHHMMYTHALGTIALCELYGMSKDSTLKDPCEKAVKYLVSVQAPEGGWRYRPGSESDTSVTGWCVLALQSARAAKLEVPNDCLQKVTRFLDSVQGDDYGYAYLPNGDPYYSMTAEALLCRQLLGMKRDDPHLNSGVADLFQNDNLTWSKDNGTHSVYGWYYATQVFHHMGGNSWEKWNNRMRVELPANQIKGGPERGSWSPDNDQYGQQGGRLYVTCLCTYMLEVYWRHMPIYKEVYDPKAGFKGGAVK